MSTPQQRSKARGRETENMVVGYLNDHGFPHAERRRLKGSADQGDITGIPGVVIEVKGDRSNRIAKWRQETVDEARNADAMFSFLVVRLERQPVEQWDAHLTAEALGIIGLPEGTWLRMDLRDALLWMKEMGH